MKRATTLLVMLVMAGWQLTAAQSTEYVFNPERTGELTDAFPVYEHNGARGLSGPWDLDQDGQVEMLVASHDVGGGVIHVIENTGVDTWELVYSTALIDSSSSSHNARYATAGDLDGDGNMEIIYFAGAGYSQETTQWQRGVFVWEHDGVQGSDNFGDFPATVGYVLELDGLGPPVGGAEYVNAQNMDVADVDGDDQEELLLPMTGSSDHASDHDIFYILSVNGDFETGGFGTTFETWIIEGRESPRERPIGGGSSFGLYAGDFNGDGLMDLSFHSWSAFNFFNWTTNESGEYVPAPDGANLHASSGIGDHVALFGGTVVDIDQDGNDEVFYPNYYTGNTSVLDYDNGDDVLIVDEDHFAFEAIPTGATGGITSGDSDGDGKLELLLGGPGYSLSNLENGDPSHFLHIAEFGGGDPKDGANYSVTQINTSSDIDTLGFHLVRQDSLGDITVYREVATSKQGITTGPNPNPDPVFPTGVAFMGDADGDGDTEVALSFQGVDDSLQVIDEVWNPDAGDSGEYERTVREQYENPVRAFVRIISLDGTATARENRLVVPSDYKLSSNYPNPFNPSTSFSITLPVDKAVSVRVYDIQGRLVRTLVDNQHYQAGTYEVQWDGTNSAGVSVASGTYLYTLEYGNFRQSKKMVLLK